MIYAPQNVLVKNRTTNLLEPKFRLGRGEATEVKNRQEGTVIVRYLGDELADKYGEIVWVLPPSAAPWTPGVMDSMHQGLVDFDGENDALLMIGNPILISMMAILAADHSSKIRFLQWSNGNYLPIELDIG